MQEEILVPVNIFSNKIRGLTFLNRITVDYPLLCRNDVARKLAEAADNLPSEYCLQVDSAYRTKKTEQILYENRKNIIPGLVNNPQIEVSSHNTGGAVDVTLTDVAGAEMNLSEPFTKYYLEPQLISDKITVNAQNLRNTLNKAMLTAGFAPHPNEYWHYSYGDRRWADYTNNKVLFNEIDMDHIYCYTPFKIFFFKVLRKLFVIKNKVLNIETNV